MSNYLDKIDEIFLKSDIMELFFNNSGLNGAVDKFGHFVYLSNSFEDELGWSLDELKKNPFMDLVHPEDAERTLFAYSNNSDYLNLYPNGFINRFKCKNGDYCYIFWKKWSYEISGLSLFSAEVIDDKDVADVIWNKIVK